jgi:calcium-dependent protein kinase
VHITQRYLFADDSAPLLGRGAFGDVMLAWELLPQEEGEDVAAWHARCRKGPQLAVKRIRPVFVKADARLRSALMPVMGVSKAKKALLGKLSSRRIPAASAASAIATAGAAADVTGTAADVGGENTPQRADAPLGLGQRLNQLADGKLLASQMHFRDRAAANREAAILQSLSEGDGARYVVRIVDHVEDLTYVYIVMTFCSGGDLMKYIANDKGFSERTASELFLSMLAGVAHCHSRGIMHRDLKPDNFLLEAPTTSAREARLRIADFGLAARISSPSEELTEVVGSPFFMAPEVISKSYTLAADCWSLGVNLYLILSGTVPFGRGASRTADVFKSILEGKLVFHGSAWAAISPQAKDIVTGLLDKNPSRRYTMEQALSHPWVVNRAGDASVPLERIIVVNMLKFNNQNKMRAEALKIVASSLTATDLSRLRTQFFQLDLNADMTISPSELGAALEKLGLLVPANELQRIVESIDCDGDGRIDLPEFVQATVEVALVHHREVALAAFARFDHDGDGFITVAEARKTLEDRKAKKRTSALITGLPAHEQFIEAEEHVVRFITEHDQDGDGRLNFEEFAASLFGVPADSP